MSRHVATVVGDWDQVGAERPSVSVCGQVLLGMRICSAITSSKTMSIRLVLGDFGRSIYIYIIYQCPIHIHSQASH